MNKISIKRIIFALAPLFLFNAVLVLDMTVFKDLAWSQANNPYSWGENDRLYTNKKNQAIKNGDQLLFEYVGEEANCWELEKEWERNNCYAKNNFGAQGTLKLGGNLVIDNAQALYMNGYDSSGHNWIMSSTSEPYGNALGAKRDRGTSLNHGNHMIVNGSITGGSIVFDKAGGRIGVDQHSCYFVSDGVYSDGAEMRYTMESNEGDYNSFIAIDRPICGECMGSCAGGDSGRGYSFEADPGVSVNGLTKVNGEVTLCDGPYNQEECEKDSGFCCRKPTMMQDPDVGGFMGVSCTRASQCVAEDPPLNCDHAGCTYCYPQPYSGDRVPPDTGS